MAVYRLPMRNGTVRYFDEDASDWVTLPPPWVEKGNWDAITKPKKHNPGQSFAFDYNYYESHDPHGWYEDIYAARAGVVIERKDYNRWRCSGLEPARMLRAF